MRRIYLADDVASALYIALEQSTDGAVQPPTATEPVVTPKKEEPSVRDPFKVGPVISQWDADKNQGRGATAISRIIAFYCDHPEIADGDYQSAYEAVVLNHADLEGQNLANAIGQDARNDTAQIEGAVFNGEVPMWKLMPFETHLQDWLYLTVINGAYMNATRQNVWHLLNGSQVNVNAGINFAGSTNAGLIATFNAQGYSGFLKPIVERHMAKGFVLSE